MPRRAVHRFGLRSERYHASGCRAWRARGWRTADKKPVKNQDLWQALSAVAARHEVEWHWVKGHSGHPENERADELANRGLDEMLARAAARLRRHGAGSIVAETSKHEG